MGLSPPSLADDGVKHGREEQPEEGDADHAVEDDRAQCLPHFRAGAGGDQAAATRRK